MKKILLLLLFLFKINTFSAVNVALFTPREENDMFFQPLIDFMSIAGKQFDMNIYPFFAKSNQALMIKQVEEAATSKFYDILVFINYKKQAKTALKIAENNKKPIFIMNSGIIDKTDVGIPGEKYKYWIGEMTPDDEEAGYLLMDYLYKKFSEDNKTSPKILAINGISIDFAAIEREKGLKRYQREKGIDILQIVNADWVPAIAKAKFLYLSKNRYDNIDIVWCASDGMGIGVVDAIEENNLDIKYVGGVDWSFEGLNAVKNNRLTATVGGHFMEGAWVVAIIFDYIKGIKDETPVYKSKMYLINKENYNEYMKKIDRKYWDTIDFRKYSKYYNKKLKKYNFDYLELKK
ncbi:MAG: hypothetical protein PWP46_1107 [Fusobacteriaceae bacterium]|jgi:ABC-type sugar transport system substrate-binding protein|nr:hypothetical protein [Fusobacteriales bacterium]MDN5304225.1 hypothetical protein [Fusobacteriaceae bacterium]